MLKITFRQSMLSGFLLIAVLLSLAAVRSWLLLERFAENSQSANAQALLIKASIQEVSARTVDSERSMRQYLVLNDKALRTRFDTNLAQASANIAQLQSMPGQLFGALPDDWRRAAEALSQGVHEGWPESRLLPYLASLGELNTALDERGQRWITEQNSVRAQELEQSRLYLTAWVTLAVLGAFLVALSMGWWLSRPVMAIERIIMRLGASRFDEAVQVHGPDDLRQIGQRLDWLRIRLRDLEADRERALRHVSHELKTPLTALREGIGLLKDEVGGPLGATQAEIVDILQHNVLSLQRHIEGLLRLNALSNVALGVHQQPVSLSALLHAVVHGRALQIQARHLRVEQHAPPLSALLDEEKLGVVLDNLLSNAIDFSPDGGLIRLQASLSDRCLRIVCSDQGPGVALSDVERIFEPFAQGQRMPAVARQGSGVGLSIVRELMVAMGGRIQLLNGGSDEGGAIFQIEMPCERAAGKET